MLSRSSFRRLSLILLSSLLSCSILTAQSETAEELAFKEAERFYLSGIAQEDHYEKGRYMNYVVSLYKKYLNNYSRSKNEPTVRFHLGYARQTLGRIEEAKNTYRTLIKRHKTGAAVGSGARQLAYLAYVEEDWKEAAKYFKLASENLAQENLRYNALTKQVQCLMKLDREDEATGALQSIVAIETHPFRDWARFMLGYQAYGKDDYESTIQALAPLVAEGETSDYRSQALFYTGLSAAELGRPDSIGEPHLRAILDLPADHPSLTPQQKKALGGNKGRAQTALMGLHSITREWPKVIELYERGNFPVDPNLEGRRSLRAGNSYYSLHRFEQARSCYRQVDRALPDTDIAFQTSFLCVQCDYHLKRIGMAEGIEVFFELYGPKYPGHFLLHAARFYQGETYFSLNKPEEAAIAFNRVSIDKLDAEYRPELLLKHGWSLSEIGQFDGASRNYTNFLADYPDDPRRPDAFNKRGEAHFALGDLNAAFRDFELVPTLKATADQITFALQGSARVLREDRKYDGMITRYRRLLTQFPNLPRDTIANANYWIGWGFYKKENYDEAPPYLRKAREMVPEFYNQQVGDLLILTAFHQRDKAALHTALQEVFEMAPEKAIPPHMLSWLGVQMYHDGQTEIAADYLNRASDPEHPKRTDTAVWRILAKVQNLTKRFEGAETTSKLLLELDQEPRWYADTHLDLAEAQLGLRKYDESLEAAKKGLAIEAPGPHVAGLNLISGEIAYFQERWEDALTFMQTTITMVPDDPILQPRALHGASLAAEKMGDTDLAQNFRNKLTSSFPKFEAPLPLEKKEEDKIVSEETDDSSITESE